MRRLRETELTPDAEAGYETAEEGEPFIIEINSDSDD
jgi:hypothetical protein